MVSRWPAFARRSPKWTEMTKERFWRCLTALPNVADTLLDISSVDGAGYDDCMLWDSNLLCISSGTLRFDVPRQAGEL